ncbi:MAG: response regulator [Proteobacteria bacterium]|nr:response regulator [Pseudomonadota bacterium]
MDRKKIVIIDDNKDYTFTMGVFLEKNGFEVHTANNGEKGMEMIEKEKPDLVLLDVMMETLFSGFEVGRKIRQHPEMKEIPIIGISGMHNEIKVKFEKETDEDYFQPDEFFEKPADKDAVLNKINQLIG